MTNTKQSGKKSAAKNTAAKKAPAQQSSAKKSEARKPRKESTSKQVFVQGWYAWVTAGAKTDAQELRTTMDKV